jgi:dihydroorotase
MGPNDKFDLLIKGGDVLDPSQSLRDRRDIGIRYGVIEALEPDIAEARALRVINASGKLVTPGLVDLHSHVLRVGYRHSCGRICGQPMRHHLCFGG